MQTFSISRIICRITICFSFLIVFSVFVGYRAEAAEPGSGLLKALQSTLHVTVSKQVEETKNVSVEPQKVYSEEITSTPHVRVSLSDSMKLFLNVQPTSKDYYDRRNNINKACTMLGFDFLF